MLKPVLTSIGAHQGSDVLRGCDAVRPWPFVRVASPRCHGLVIVQGDANTVELKANAIFLEADGVTSYGRSTYCNANTPGIVFEDDPPHLCHFAKSGSDSRHRLRSRFRLSKQTRRPRSSRLERGEKSVDIILSMMRDRRICSWR